MILNYFKFFSARLRLSKPWKFKIPLLIGFTYLFLINEDLTAEKVWFSFLASICTTIGFAGFGYLTNDLSDRKADKLAGKANQISELTNLSISGLFLSFCSMALLPWLYLPVDKYSLLLIALEFLLFVIYAFPPFRLKEKGVVALITDALYAHMIPAILASWTFYLIGGKSFENILIFLILIGNWQLFSGIRNIMNHQINDHDNDLLSETKTFANTAGKEVAIKMVKYFLIPLETLAFVTFLVLLQYQLVYFIPLLAIFWLWKLVTFNRKKHQNEQADYQRLTTHFLDEFYILWFPLIMLAYIAYLDPLKGVPILIAHCLIFRNVAKDLILFIFKKVR